MARGEMTSPLRCALRNSKRRDVAEVFFEVGVFLQVFGVDLRDGQAVTTKMARKLEEGDVFFAHRIDDADGPATRARKANDGAAQSRRVDHEVALRRRREH